MRYYKEGFKEGKRANLRTVSVVPGSLHLLPRQVMQ